MDNALLKDKIREIKDFPIPGVSFKDITPLLEDGISFRCAVESIAGFFKDKQVDKVVGIDARGFLLSSAVAYILGAGMVIVRKKGKLPYETIIKEHHLEYGKGALEIHIDSIKKGERILIVDDVLATGGTAKAAIKLVEDLEGDLIGLGFLIELPLGGREVLIRHHVRSLIQY